MAVAFEKEALRMAIEVCTMEDFKNYIMAVVWMEDAKIFKKNFNINIEVFLSSYFGNNPAEEAKRRRMVSGFVNCIAVRMLIWLEHHVGILKLDRNFCLSLLTPNIFTEKGIIDCDKTIELVENEVLGIDKRFRLASWHCLKKQCCTLFNALGYYQSIFYRNDSPAEIFETDIVKYWAFYLKGDLKLLNKEPEVEVGFPGKLEKIGKPEDQHKPLRSVNIEEIKGEASIFKFMLKSSISSGSQTAINYCLRDARREFLSETLIDIVIYRMQLGDDFANPNLNVVDDWVAFRCPKYNIISEIWVPSHYLVDTFYSIFSKLNDDEILKIAPKLKDRINVSKVRMSRKLQLFSYFLCWPHQNLFMKFVNSCWDHITFDYFGQLLLDIFDRIDPSGETLYYGEHIVIDYGKMFTEFWCHSPENFKRYVFEDLTVDNGVLNLGRELLLKMTADKLTFWNHLMIIRDFFNKATVSERRNLLNSTEGSRICDFLLTKKNDKILNEVIMMCTESIDEAMKFRRNLAVVGECLNSIKVGDFIKAQNAISSLKMTEYEVNQIKEMVVYCNEGMKLFTDFGFENAERFSNFVKWCEFDSPLKTKYLVKTLLKNGRWACRYHAIESPEKADQFLKLCYSLVQKGLQLSLSIKKFKNDVAKEEGMYFCGNIIVRNNFIPYITEETKIWKRLVTVDKFIKWCFSSPPFESNGINEDENKRNEEAKIEMANKTRHEASVKNENDITKYREKLIKHADYDIHYHLIKLSRFQDAFTIFYWAGFTSDYIDIFRKSKLFNCRRTAGLLTNAVELNRRYLPTAEVQSCIISILTWCLVDQANVNAFIDKFSRYRNDPFIRYVITEILDYEF